MIKIHSRAELKNRRKELRTNERMRKKDFGFFLKGSSCADANFQDNIVSEDI